MLVHAMEAVLDQQEHLQRRTSASALLSLSILPKKTTFCCDFNQEFDVSTYAAKGLACKCQSIFLTKKLFSPVSDSGGSCWIPLQTKRRNCQSLDVIRRGSSKVSPSPPCYKISILGISNAIFGIASEKFVATTEMHREKFTCSEEVGNFPLKALTSRLEKRLKMCRLLTRRGQYKPQLWRKSWITGICGRKANWICLFK